ncbi:MAG: serine protease, partial [Clostridiales bacterium]|nr:serine protease [Clostridiales bacterium]
MGAFLLTNLPIILFFLTGVVFLVLEVFTPGFGIAGIAGIIAEVLCVVAAFKIHGGLVALGVTLIVLAVIAIVVSIMLKSAASGRLSKSGIILTHEETPEKGYVSTKDAQVLVGKKGKTKTVLRPTGIAEFEGIRLDVVTEGEFVEMNSAVRIEKVDGPR